MIVCKFGGSSLATADRIKMVKKIIGENHDRKIIVLSAIGKKNQKDKKLTDLLIDLCELRGSNNFIKAFNLVKKKMTEISFELGKNPEYILNFESFKEQILNGTISKEYIISRGEYFTAKLCASYFSFDFIPAEDIFIGDGNKKIDEVKTLNNLKKIDMHHPVVIPGFYYFNGKGIGLFERGGSDLSGAIIAKLLNADSYENFTDVNGIYNINPDLGINYVTINSVNYSQAYDCTLNGASVFHHRAIFPLAEKAIKSEIINTFDHAKKKTFLGKKGEFFYLNEHLDFYCFNKPKNISKSRFIKDIFKTFTLNEICAERIFYNGKRLAFCIKNGENSKFCKKFKNHKFHSFIIFIYGEKYIKKIRYLAKFFKRLGIIFYLKNYSPITAKVRIILLYNKNLPLKNIVEILQN